MCDCILKDDFNNLQSFTMFWDCYRRNDQISTAFSSDKYLAYAHWILQPCEPKFRAIFSHISCFCPSSIKAIKDKYLIFKSLEIFLYKCKFCFETMYFLF